MVEVRPVRLKGFRVCRCPKRDHKADVKLTEFWRSALLLGVQKERCTHLQTLLTVLPLAPLAGNAVLLGGHRSAPAPRRPAAAALGTAGGRPAAGHRPKTGGLVSLHPPSTYTKYLLARFVFCLS